WPSPEQMAGIAADNLYPAPDLDTVLLPYPVNQIGCRTRRINRTRRTDRTSRTGPNVLILVGLRRYGAADRRCGAGRGVAGRLETCCSSLIKVCIMTSISGRGRSPNAHSRYSLRKVMVESTACLPAAVSATLVRRASCTSFR